MNSRTTPGDVAQRPASAAPGATIRVVSHRTGLSPDTLRVWERRYGFPKPGRSEGGVRVYAPEDIVRLELIARSISAGWRPHEVVALPLEELRRIAPPASGDVAPALPALDASRARATAEVSLDAIVSALERDDLVSVRSQLRSAAVVLGPKSFVTEVAHPLAVRIGAEWHAGTLGVRHEHALTAALTMQLHLLLGAHEDPGAGPQILLATLPEERHALALDMVAVYLAASHAAPRLLGPELPPDQLVAAAVALAPAVVGVSVSTASDGVATSRALAVVARGLRPTKTTLWIGGSGATDLELPSGVVRVGASFPDLDAALAAVRR